MTTPARVFPGSVAVAASINHLLAQEPWARDKLAAHSGKTACMATELATLKLSVLADGLLAAADDATAPNVTIRLKLADLPLVLQNPERAVSYVSLDGDADFASTISQLALSLRWEPEHDLQPLVGEIAATRMVEGAKAAFQSAKSGHQKLFENLAEYFLEENPMLVRPLTVGEFGDAVAQTRDDVERLEKRIDKLENRVGNKMARKMQEKMDPQ